MVVRIWLLILLSTANLFAAEPGKDISHCLECHPSHYTDLGTCVACHRGFSGTARINIAHDGLIAARFSSFTIDDDPTTKRGEELLKNYACRRCHTSGDKGNRLAANLDFSQLEKTPEELEEAIQFPVLFMPEFHFSQQQRVELINAILLGGRQVKIPEQELPEVVHFEGEEVTREFQFEKYCGGCHRALTARFGGLGSGLIGPNLSGIFSEFYVLNFGEDKKRWSIENLEKWLKNPRKIRPFAQMPPVELKKEEFESICNELQHQEPVNNALPEAAELTAPLSAQ
ncbi:MAG: selenite/tellurite reduction operon c-type cytochrome lipoprotein ExtS [Deltaproteobacteria bacterium]|nr:selenite/tellurite reduction operon c-type cytochrome lipoprotein ExtS [Deltaproteobacteria bacterium]MCW8893225.1 selenite/tellurite reduction operon c-type cytochrome lipoprotein ExtS [Deltaproteobacteria bacterium]MCW9050273.1 selenite/tellurite reduction operon c-type cytochrome lipoprotein ExtS [Deltaproteobacteria bacterium]